MYGRGIIREELHLFPKTHVGGTILVYLEFLPDKMINGIGLGFATISSLCHYKQKENDTKVFYIIFHKIIVLKPLFCKNHRFLHIGTLVFHRRTKGWPVGGLIYALAQSNRFLE